MSSIQKNLFFSFVTVIGSKVLGILSLSILSRIVLKDYLAVFTAIVSTVESVGHIILLGTNVVLCISVTKLYHKEHYKELFIRVVSAHFWVCVISAVLLVVVYFFKYPLHSFLMGGKGNVNNLFIVVVSVFFYTLGLLSFSVMLGLGKFKQNAVRSLLISVIYILLVPTSFYFLGPYGGILSIIVYYGCTSVFSFFYIRKEVYNIIRLPITLSHLTNGMKSLITEGFLYFLGHNLLMSLQAILLTSLIIANVGLHNVTYLKFAASVCTIILIIPSTIQSVSSHFLARQDHSDSVVQFKALQLKVVMLFSIIAVAFCIFFSGNIIALLFSSRYLSSNEIVAFQLLCTLMVVPCMCISNFQSAEGRLNTTGIITIISGSIFLLASLFLIPVYRLKGYFISYFIFNFINLILSLYYELKYTNYKKHFISFLFILFCILVLLISQFFLRDYSIGIKIMTFFGFLLFCTYIGYQAVFSKIEKGIIENMYKSYYSKFLSIRQ